MLDQHTLPNFYKLQELAHRMDIAYSSSREPDLFKAFQGALTSNNPDEYERLVKRAFQDKLIEIKELFFEDYFEASNELAFSGALTFFSRHSGFKDKREIRFFLGWELVCPEEEPFRYLNKGLEKHLCADNYYQLAPGDRPKYIRAKLASFLHNLNFSASNLVDKILPYKKGFAISLENIPDNQCLQGAVFNALWDLKRRLVEGDLKKRDIPLLEEEGPIARNKLKAALEEIDQKANLEDIDKAVPFLEDLYSQIAKLLLTSNSENIACLKKLGGEKPYSLSNLIEFAISLLIVPTAKSFYFFHFGLGHHTPDSHSQNKTAARRLASGTLIVFNHTDRRLDDFDLCIIHDLVGIVMSSLSRLEYASIVSELEVEKGRAEAMGKALVHYGHTLAHRVGPVLDYFDGLDESRERAAGSVQMLKDLGFVLQLSNVKTLDDIWVHSKKQRFLAYQKDTAPLELVHLIKYDCSKLVEMTREIKPSADEEKMLEAWVTLSIRGKIKKAFIDHTLKDVGDSYCRLGDFIYRELFYELLHNAINYGTPARGDGFYRKLPVYKVMLSLGQDFLDGLPVIVLRNFTRKKPPPPFISKDTWEEWPYTLEHDGPGMAIATVRRFDLGQMWYCFNKEQMIFSTAVHFDKMRFEDS